jgi:eukaryotic-like serine/threonine-protein kinase
MVQYATLIGQTLSHYRIVEKIGAGGMGEVYRAYDERLERDVALKVLQQGLLTGDTARRRFRREALALSRLNHPNIATIHDFDTHEGVDFLIMEYVAGETLSDKLHGGPLTEKEVARLGMQLAEGLTAAHEQGIIHRDLKPGNTRLTIDGRLKILDFGLATLVRSATETTESAQTVSLDETRGPVGTLPYMSPEQLRGELVDARTDIWSAGALLYRMAAGRPAFPEAESAKLITSILTTAPVPPSGVNRHISSGLENIILKCLEKDPDDRYQSTKELAVDLRRLLAPNTAAHPLPKWRASIGKRVSIAVGLSVAILLCAILLFNPGGARNKLFGGKVPAPIRSLVVLPLANLSGDPEQEYFADGMTEALVTDLSKIRSLKVISRTSSIRYKEEKKTLPQIARELSVDGVVQGSVLRAGDKVRISAQLIYAPNGQHLWAESYERDFKDVLTLQGEVAQAIASNIRIEVTPQEQARLTSGRQVNPAAQEAFLRGRYLNKGTRAEQRRAREYFEQALRIDPNYAPAYAGLADYYISSVDTRPLVSMPQAKQFALKALELDPDLAEAHVELALIHFYADWDWVAADKEFKLAIQLNPSDAEAHRISSFYFSALGRVEEALAESRQAQQLDPLSIWTQITSGYVFYFARRYDEAVAQCGKALEWDRNSAGAYDCLGASYLAKGMNQQAIASSLKASDLANNDPARLVGLGRAYGLTGRKSDARKVLEQLRQFSGHTYVSPYFFAAVYASLGQNDEAFARLQEALREHDSYLAWLKVDSAVDPLRQDTRFQKLLYQVGLTN